MTRQIFSLAKSILGRRGSISSPESETQVKSDAGDHEYGLLFDTRYYCSQVTGLKPAQTRQHFADQGWHAGICPHPLFNTNYYLEQLVCFDPHGDPLQHFMTEGWRAGKNPHPLFDVQTYLAAAGNAFDQSCDPLTHFLERGWQAGFDPHCLVNLSYCGRLKNRRNWKKCDPLTACLQSQFSNLIRPYPLMDVNRIVTQLKFKGKPVDTQTIAREFAQWDAPTSPSPLFDQSFYLDRNPSAAAYPGGPFWHYIHVGQYDNRDPNPYFSCQYYCDIYGQDLRGVTPFLHYMTNEATLKYNPCEGFNVAHYGSNHPHVSNSGRSLLEHFLSTGRYHSREIVPHVIPPFLLKDVKEAALIDPTLRFSRNRLLKLPVIDRHQSAKTAQDYELLCGQLQKPFRVLVLVPFLKRGAATLATANLIKALRVSYGADDILLLLTDTDEASGADWLPVGTRKLTLSDLDANLKNHEREMILRCLLEEFRPEICYNINSQAGWDLFSNYGRGISHNVALCAFLFYRDFHNLNQPADYATSHFPRAINFLSEVYLNSRAFRREVNETFGIPPSKQAKLKVLYQPINERGYRVDTEQIVQRLERDNSYRRQVYWMGKLDRQKYLEILGAIALQCPEMDFHVYGTSGRTIDEPAAKNVTFYEGYFDFFNLPLSDADMFLYTSARDGLSQFVIDAMQAGIPVVAPDAGGISELVNGDTGWLIPQADNLDAYVGALKDIANNSPRCRQRIMAGIDHVVQQHNLERHNAVLRQFQESFRLHPVNE